MMCSDLKNIRTNVKSRVENRSITHLAAEAGLRWSEGFELVLKKENFETLSLVDMETGLLPFMIAAADNHSDLSTVYEMISIHPELIFRC
mmetsp:Transcript_18819/g.23094  ORF Transcript_18819/g.23094 Transcript_18819/m.23094 type:complete len:90 (+) Transcript_18819:165-434(+)